ncbi:MAG: 2-oxoacid:acceptor oxidoreductase family protein [Clostridia bacterium]
MDNCEMILAGFGGQGILFAGKILAHAAMLKNKHLSWLPSYGPEMRGGTANCHVIIDDEPVGSPIIVRPDILVAMNKPSLDKFEDKVVSGGTVFADSSLIDRKVGRSDIRAVYVDATKIADSQGRKVLANMVMLGAVIRETGLFTIEEIKRAVEKAIPPKKAALMEPNIAAVTAGYNYVK